MPIYEFSCKDCGNEFEALVRKAEPKCPSCGKANLERKLSLPSVKSDSTRANAMKAAKKRDKQQATDRVQTQTAYEKSHDD